MRVMRATLIAVVLSLALSGEAAAHPGHAEHSDGSLRADLLLLGAAGLAVAGVTVGGVAIWRRQASTERAVGRLHVWAGGLMAVAVVAAGAGWYAGDGAGDSSPIASAQSYGGTPLSGAAPDFRLVDQRGEAIALPELRGRVVLLAFLDPNCTDICPLTAHHFGLVAEQLGAAAGEVAFLAVNVNPGANGVEDVARATEKWQIADLASWHFLTGSAEELRPVWLAYTVEAGNPKTGKPGEVAHSPGVYVIDRRGERRWYVSIPQDALLGAPWEGPAFDELLLQHVETLLEE